MIRARLSLLREEMKREGLSAFIFPSSDAHNSEYTPAHWHGREWISGFNGSAGTAVVTLTKAALWTDSRYFIAAEQQLENSEFQLMKEGLAETPSITRWLGMALAITNNAEVGIDGYCCSHSEVQRLKQELRHEGGITLRTNLDIIERIWDNRPKIPQNKVYIYPQEYCGYTCMEKLQQIRNILKKQHACGLLITQLDEIAWTLNLRGTDIDCTPVFVAYLLLDGERTTLYIDKEKLTPEVISYLHSQGVAVDEYKNIVNGLQKYSQYNILLNPESINSVLYNKVVCNEILNAPSPVQMLKAVKNPTEIKGLHNAMVKDGIALIKFMKWLQGENENSDTDSDTDSKPQNRKKTEITASDKLLEFKRQQPLFKDISFHTISAFDEHGAIVHYEPTPETDAQIIPNGILLLDCGSQYLDGTTDITRTFAIGTPTNEQKYVCTLVLKAHIRMAMAKWVEGTNGTQLDILARGVLWEEGYHYAHGTGHGVGSFLSCHEGPHQIRMQNKPTPLVAGMIVTDEPGVYIKGKFGCRIENMLLVVPAEKGVQGENFFHFETLTLCPYDKSIIDVSMLTEAEKQWIDTYHQQVFECLSPHLDDAERDWLRQACAPIYSSNACLP